jgi:hypothetical protein
MQLSALGARPKVVARGVTSVSVLAAVMAAWLAACGSSKDVASGPDGSARSDDGGLLLVDPGDDATSTNPAFTPAAADGGGPLQGKRCTSRRPSASLSEVARYGA